MCDTPLKGYLNRRMTFKFQGEYGLVIDEAI